MIVLTGLVILIGKNHFLLGSLYSILLWPLILSICLKALIAIRKGKFNQEKYLSIIGGLLLLSWAYDHIPRINWEGEKIEQKQLSILTYNLFFKNQYKQQVINEIKANKPDVLLVQELSSAWDQKLQASVYTSYKYRKTFVNNRTRGIGIFSRYPILSHHLINNRRGLPVFQICELSLDGQNIVMVNTHMSSPARVVEDPDAPFFPVYQANYTKRESEWEQLENYLETHFPDHPKIIAGDLNTMKIEGLYRQIRHNWVDVFAKKGEGWSYTFPNAAQFPFPMITLDYIFGKGIKPLEAKVLKGGSSDHFAVWGKIAICE